MDFSKLTFDDIEIIDDIGDSTSKSFTELVEKFNPYHDRLGRFTTAGGAASFTIRTRSGLWQGANDKAIQREKEQHAKTMPTAEQESTLKGIETRTRNLKKEQLRVVDREGNVILTKQGDKHSVGYTVGEAREHFHGNITIHNHPEGGTFSSADLSDIGYGATEIRAAAPEGTYILRNMRVGQKWSNQKSWYEMREDYEAAESNFRGKSIKDNIKLKSEIRARHTEENQKLKELADKSIAARNSGNIEEADKYYSDFNKLNDSLKQTVEKEVRTYITNQHHDWIKSNAANYGLEYEFRPTRTRTRKSFYEEDITMVSKSNDEIVLDRKLNNDIAEITEEIMDSFGDERMAKTFSEIEKFNPYHDRLGRFTSPGGATSFTYAPGRSKAHDMAIAREKERNASPASKYGLTQEQADDLINNSSVISFNQKTKEMGWDEEKRNKFKEEFNVKEKWRERAQRRVEEEKQQQERARQELDERVKEELPGLNQDAIRRANDVSFFEHGNVAARNALRRVDDYRERNKITDDMTDEQKAYMKQREEEYKQLVTEYYNDSNMRFANNPSWAITGPANYNTRASQKKSDAAARKAQEYEEKLQRFEENTQKRLKSMEPEEKQISRWRNGQWKHGETISGDDPLAEKKLTAKLEYHQEQQQTMKDANAYYRRNGSMKGFEGFSESTNERIDSALNSRTYGEKKPFATYELTNNNASIKSTQARLNEVRNRQQRAAASGGTGGSTKFDGGEVVRNEGINRLQIKFDSIPDAATRQQLKSSGWRWSPKEGAWQRQLTDNAERSANSILGLNKSYNSQNVGKKAIYIGLNVSGGDSLRIDGGENPEDYHVTLIYGYHSRSSDSDDISKRVQNAIDSIRPMIPDELKIDRIDTFEPSKSSDGKKVVYARIAEGQLEKVHDELNRNLINNGLRIEDTFPEYHPHMTLAYISPENDFEPKEINHVVKSKNITIGIEDEEGSTHDNAFTIQKADDDKRLVFGWANVATRANGEVIQDWQNDIVEPEDLEEAVYEYVLNFRDGGEEHIPGLRKKCRMVESVVFTDEKLKAMGIPKGTVPLGWWIGFKVDDLEAWKKIKNGTYTMFSVEGSGQRIPTTDLPTKLAKTFLDMV